MDPTRIASVIRIFRTTKNCEPQMDTDFYLCFITSKLGIARYGLFLLNSSFICSSRISIGENANSRRAYPWIHQSVESTLWESSQLVSASRSKGLRRQAPGRAGFLPQLLSSREWPARVGARWTRPDGTFRSRWE